MLVNTADVSFEDDMRSKYGPVKEGNTRILLTASYETLQQDRTLITSMQSIVADDKLKL